jgi:hypothetical protein
MLDAGQNPRRASSLKIVASSGNSAGMIQINAIPTES